MLNANLLPSKVASPARGDAADPATNGIAPRLRQLCLDEAILMDGGGAV
jgi:hypothetical protein